MKFRVHFHKSIPRGGEHPVRATHGIRDRRRKDELPPDPGDARMEKYGFYIVPSAGSNIPVEFTVDESGKVDLSLRGTGTKGSEIERGRWAETIFINF